MNDIIEKHIIKLKNERESMQQQIELDNKWYEINRLALKDLDILIAKLERPE